MVTVPALGKGSVLAYTRKPESNLTLGMKIIFQTTAGETGVFEMSYSADHTFVMPTMEYGKRANAEFEKAISFFTEHNKAVGKNFMQIFNQYGSIITQSDIDRYTKFMKDMAESKEGLSF